MGRLRDLGETDISTDCDWAYIVSKVADCMIYLSSDETSFPPGWREMSEEARYYNSEWLGEAGGSAELNLYEVSNGLYIFTEDDVKDIIVMSHVAISDDDEELLHALGCHVVV